MILRFLSFCMLFFLSCAVFATQDSSLAYTIILEKPDQEGQVFRMKSDVKRKIRSVSRFNNGKLNEELIDLTTVFEADIKVLKINAQNSATLIEATIIQMTSKDSARPDYPIFYKGTRIVAALAQGKTIFSSDGLELTEVQSGELSLFLSLSSGGINDQTVFGSKIPRKVGETWQPNHVAAAKLLGSDINLPPQKIEGTVTFLSLDSGIVTLNESLSASAVPVDFGVPAVKRALIDVLYKQEAKFPLIPSAFGCYLKKGIMRLSVSIDAINEKGESFTTKQTTMIEQSTQMYTVK